LSLCERAKLNQEYGSPESGTTFYCKMLFMQVHISTKHIVPFTHKPILFQRKKPLLNSKSKPAEMLNHEPLKHKQQHNSTQQQLTLT